MNKNFVTKIQYEDFIKINFVAKKRKKEDSKITWVDVEINKEIEEYEREDSIAVIFASGSISDGDYFYEYMYATNYIIFSDVKKIYSRKLDWEIMFNDGSREKLPKKKVGKIFQVF